MWPPVLLAALLACCAGLAAAAEAEGSCPAGDAECGAGAAAAGGQGAYYWPQQKGDVNRTGLSPYVAPSNLAAGPTWHWADPHLDVISQSPLIDDKLNIYFNTRGSRIYKFSPDGQMIWTFRSTMGLIGTVPALMDGSLYANTVLGYVLALDMETGRQRWAVRVAASAGSDSACLLAVNGTVVAAVEAAQGEGNLAVAAVDAAGRLLWTFRTAPWRTYNFQASSPGDGSIVFQDAAGGLYRLRLSSGQLVWQSGIPARQQNYFTTAAAVVGPNGLVYAASNCGAGGVVHVYRLADGAPVWRRDVVLPANQAVALGPLAGSRGNLGVVAGIGDNPGVPPLLGYAYFSPLQLLVCGIIWVLWRSSCSRLCARCWWLPELLQLLPFALPPLHQLLADHSRVEAKILPPIVLNASQFAFAQYLLLRCLLRRPWWHERPGRARRYPLLALLFVACYYSAALGLHALSQRWEGWPEWFWHTSVLPSALVALDAEAGTPLWSFSPPPFRLPASKGDEALLLQRLQNVALGRTGHPICLPDSWSQAVISADGTAFAGFMDGRLYRVRDADGDGEIRGEAEAAWYDFSNGFQGSQAIAPGMLAVIPCGGGLYVWRS